MLPVSQISRKKFYESTNSGVYINSGQPGVGRKTSGFINYVVRDFKTDKKNKVKMIGFFSSNHNLLTEVEKNLIRNDIPCIHLEGWNRLCPLAEDSEILEMYNTLYNPKDTVCEKCPQKSDCQFTNCYMELKNSAVKVVLSPLELLHSKKLNSQLTMIFVDESADKKTNYDVGHKTHRFERFRDEMLKISDKPHYDRQLIDIVGNTIWELTTRILLDCSIIYNRSEEELQQIDDGLFVKKEFKTIIQKGNWITHIEIVNPKKIWEELDESSRKCITNENNFVGKLFWRVKKAITKGGLGSPIVKAFVDVISEINAIQYLFECKSDRNFTLIINEKIELVKGRPISDKKDGMIDHQTFYHKIDDTHYLKSTIGHSYSNQKKKYRPESWITFGVSFYEKIFELAKDKPVKLLDASYNETHFTKLYYTYSENVQIYHYKPEIKNNPKSVLYLVETQKGLSNYSKATLGIRNRKVTKNGIYLQSLKPKLDILIKQLMKEGKKVGMITLQELVKDWTGLLGTDMVLHFGYCRGTNLLKKVDVLIILGTMFHPIKTLLFDYVMTYHELPENIEAKFDGEKFDGYQDRVLNEFFKIRVMEELYQGNHRIRPLIHDKIIISLSRLPKKITDYQEFTIKEMSLNEVCAEVLDLNRYYRKFPDESRESVVPKVNYDFLTMRERVLDGTLINSLPFKWGLSEEDTKELLLEVFEPIMNSILRCNWERKKPLINAVTNSVYNKSRSTKRKKRGLKGYTRKEIYFAIALLEQQDIIEVKKVSLNSIYHDTKRGEGYLIKFNE